MIPKIDKLRVEDVVQIIRRRFWFFIIPLFFALPVGIYLAHTLPKIYRSTTLVMVIPQRVPQNYVQPIVSTSIESRLRTISQQIMSRTSIEKIIHDFKLFSDPEHKDMFLEDKIESVRSRIEVNVSTGNTFTISFSGDNPETVMKITLPIY